MILTTILAACAIGALPASDFFPLVPGTKRTFEEIGPNAGVTIDEVGQPIEIEGKQAFPVTTFQFGRRVSSLYYSVDDKGAYIVALGAERAKDGYKTLPVPIPVFKIEGERLAWEFRGYAEPPEQDRAADTVVVSGVTRLAGQKEVMGKKVDVIEVKTTAQVGSPRFGEKTEQTAYYAKGIGLVEMKSKTQMGKLKTEVGIKLVGIESKVRP